MSIIGLGVAAFILLFLGWKRNFFTFSQPIPQWDIPLRWTNVVAVFGIYFAVLIAGAPLLVVALRTIPFSSPVALSSWLNFLISFLILVLVLFYALRLPNAIFLKIWRRSWEKRPSYIQDVGFALWAFLFAFPLVIFLNETFDFLLDTVFHIQQIPDQLAVRFLKMTFHYPFYFFLTIITIVVLAPILEETLFRGFLQSFIRKYLGARWAIFVTALSFAFFHYAKEQGAANLTIVGSLFALALFLGFVYEKRGSLVTSMSLHAIFNATNVLNLYFFGDF